MGVQGTCPGRPLPGWRAIRAGLLTRRLAPLPTGSVFRPSRSGCPIIHHARPSSTRHLPLYLRGQPILLRAPVRRRSAGRAERQSANEARPRPLHPLRFGTFRNASICLDAVIRRSFSRGLRLQSPAKVREATQGARGLRACRCRREGHPQPQRGREQPLSREPEP